MIDYDEALAYYKRTGKYFRRDIAKQIKKHPDTDSICDGSFENWITNLGILNGKQFAFRPVTTGDLIELLKRMDAM